MRQDDSSVAQKRVNPLKDTEDVEVVASLRDQSLAKLVTKLEEIEEGKRTTEIWRQGNVDRAELLKRQRMLLSDFDEFIEPIYAATNEWSSTLHLPTVYTVCKTFHARFLAALLGVDPPFNVRARQGYNADRAMLIQELMRYTLASWVNVNKGIEDEVDRWIWGWITSGAAILKGRWEKRYTRYVDVVEKETVTSTQMVPDETGSLVAHQTKGSKEVEELVTEEIFNGPMLEFKNGEDVLIIGGNGDPQEADEIIEQDYLTASQLWQLADQKIFRADIVAEIIKNGEQLKGAEPVNDIKMQQAAESGRTGIDVVTDAKRYQILERYAKIDVDGSGIASEIIMWVHGTTGKILRATYLRRATKSGLVPYFRIEFHKRANADSAGLPELLYSLAREIDAAHNMKVDFGVISSMPFGFYRSTSSLATEKMPVEPGVMIPLDNPQTDVFFPQLGQRSGFSAQEEQALYQQIERMTSISDMSLGVIGGQGAARTATGARALLGESNANLDVYLRRMNRGWKRAIVYIFNMLQERMPEGFQFRILGDDGSYYWETVKSKKELAGSYDFELEANSANSNKQIQIEQAGQLFATLMNPLLLQMQIVSPLGVYNALKSKLQTEGVKDFSRYISKPVGATRVYTPEEIANATLGGVDLPLGPEQDLQGFVDYYNHILEHDELLGQFNEQQTIALAKKAVQAQQMLQAVQHQQAQVANQQQIATNTQLTTGPATATPSPTAQLAPPSGSQGA